MRRLVLSPPVKVTKPEILLRVEICVIFLLLQVICDMKNYFEKEINEGRKPKFNLNDLKGILSDKVEFLR